MNWEVGMDNICITDTIYKSINNENILYSSGNCTQCSVVI